MKLFRTWGSGLGMLPIGGPAVWGNSTWAPDDTEEMKENNQTYGCFPVSYTCVALLSPKIRYPNPSLVVATRVISVRTPDGRYPAS